MAQPPQSESEIPTPEPPSSEPEDVLRLVCGWNDKTNTYLYRDEVINPPPIYGNGPGRASKRPKKASAKVRLSRGEDVKFSSADAKPSNVAVRGKEKMEKLRREWAQRRAKKAPPRQQPSPSSTPASEAGHRSHRKKAPCLSGGSESSDSDEDSSDEVPPDVRLYAVPDHLQGTTRPVPRPDNSQEVQWKDMQITTVPLPEDPTVKIGGFDNIMVTLVSPDNGKPHNKPAKVLDCRLHPDGTYFLLVSWWFERRTLSTNLVGFKRYLDRKWPMDAPFKFILGCHFDVITNDAITEKMSDDERFCNSMVYGGVTHNCELFSDVPDEVERRECIKKGAKGDARLMEEGKQKSLFRMLLRPG
ncbi:hypothetical protein V500_02702 [Pseudogymnoascus sp. VKM F-4518 (FW-2643)]|nr:hypothetical protein V500_02702 [Pseudogymnoascus sp. VKM F-4518 (FW-2643)]